MFGGACPAPALGFGAGSVVRLSAGSAAEEELALLSEAFGKVGYGKILVECESPVALSPTCLANIKFMDQIREVWNTAGRPNVTFLTPPAILRPILHTLEIPYTLL